MSNDTTNERSQFTEGLRQIADFLDAHPEVPLPYMGGSVTGEFLPTMDIILVADDGQKDTVAAIARAMGKAGKNVRNDRFHLFRKFAGVVLSVNAARDQVCERIVTGTREIEIEEPDAEALAKVPTVTKKVVVEDVEWECKPLLDTAPIGGAS